MDEEAGAEALGRRLAELVTARREAGEYDHDLEAWMDEHFRRVAGRPGEPPLGEVLAAVARVQAHPPFHLPDVGSTSRLPGGAAVHAAVGSLLTRHLQELVSQLNAYADTVRDSVAALAEVVSIPRHLIGQLQSMDDRLAEVQRTVNRIADAAVDHP